MKKFDIFGEIWQSSECYVRRKEISDCIDYPRQDKGELPVRMPSPETFQRSKDLGLFSAFRIGCDFWPRREKLEALDPEKEMVHIDLLRVRSDFDRPENQALGIPYEEFAENYFNTAIDYSLEHPGRVILCVIGEVDSGCRWPEYFFRSREEAYDFFKESCFNYTGMYSDVGRFFEILKKRGLSLKDVNAMIHGACRFAIPYYFEWEYPHVEIERGLGASLNMQISMGVLRGAWKQFGRRACWGVDVSTHQNHYNQCTWYNSNGMRIGGFSEDWTERHWLHSFFAGADYLLCEGSDYTHWVFQSDGSFELSDLGKRAQRFADFTLRSGVDRGTPVVPAAVMIDWKNGYEEGSRGGYIWGNKLPVTKIDTNIGAIYDVFYPGHANVWGSERILSPATGSDTRQNYRAALERGEDMRYMEIGYFTSTPYGDTLDTVWGNAPLSFLKEYKVLITAGSVKLPENILEGFVMEGGTLATSIDKLNDKMKETLGIITEPPLLSDWEYDRITRCGTDEFSDGLRYVFSRLKFSGDTEILAENSRRIPIIASIPCGKGKVLLCTVPLGQDFTGSVILPLWGKVMGEEVKKHLGIGFSSQGKLSVSVNACDDGSLMLELINPMSEPWTGTLSFKKNFSEAAVVYPEKRKLEFKKENLHLELSSYASMIVKLS